MKVGIITFHASHNYGSMLQAYALQHIVTRLGHECEIINFRTQRQRKFYRPFFCREGLKNKLKLILFPKQAINEYKKYRLFENFLKNRYKLTKKIYTTSESLKEETFKFDAYISGSDQIWNPSAFDHDESYFLGFVKSGLKIAYAPSMGPFPRNQASNCYKDTLIQHLPSYSHISVREEQSSKCIEELTGIRANVTLDPTLLLESEEWNKLAGHQPLIKGEYIFLYTPWGEYDIYSKAVEIAEKLGLKLVISMPHYIRELAYKSNIIYKIDTGPEEFLNLLKFSKFVISGSFHAVVFSIIMQKPFYAIGGNDDSRIMNLLKLADMEDLADIQPSENSIRAFEPHFKAAIDNIQRERDHSLAFLRNALGDQETSKSN